MEYTVIYDNGEPTKMDAKSLAEVSNKARRLGAKRVRIWSPAGLQLVDTKFGDGYDLVTINYSKEPEIKEPTISNKDREILAELHECGGQVDNTEYSSSQQKILKNLERQHLVALRWVITHKGKKVIGQ